MFEYLVFSEENAFQGQQEIRIEVDGARLRYRLLDETISTILPESGKEVAGIYSGDVEDYIRQLESFDVSRWKDEYFMPMCDGYSWNLRYKEVGKPCRKITGSNDCPVCFEEFVDHLFSISIDNGNEMGV